MRVVMGLLAFAGLALVGGSVEAAPVKVLRKWESRIPLADQTHAPATGYLAGPRAMAALWKAWKIPGALPAVNWKTELLLVAATQASSLSIQPKLSPTGDLTIDVISTDDLPPDAGYQIAVIPLAGVKTVHGKKLKLEPGKVEEPKD